MATKSTPDSVDLKLANYSTTAAMNGAIASANNATLASVASTYALKTVVDQHALDIAARITLLQVDTKVANALLAYVTAVALAAELAPRDAAVAALQSGKADAADHDTSAEVDSKIAAALLPYVTQAAADGAFATLGSLAATDAALAALQADTDSSLEVDTKIANALLPYAAVAFLDAELAVRDATLASLQASKADASLLASYATNAALSVGQRDHAASEPRRNPGRPCRPADL